MDFQLFSIEGAPRNLPIWTLILDDLNRPSPERLAKALGVSARTVYRWNTKGAAPRSACMALFWLTRWGRSELDAKATNDAMLLGELLRSLRDERNTLHHQVRCLTDELDNARAVNSRYAKELTSSLTTAGVARIQQADVHVSPVRSPGANPQGERG